MRRIIILLFVVLLPYVAFSANRFGRFFQNSTSLKTTDVQVIVNPKTGQYLFVKSSKLGGDTYELSLLEAVPNPKGGGGTVLRLPKNPETLVFDLERVKRDEVSIFDSNKGFAEKLGVSDQNPAQIMPYSKFKEYYPQGQVAQASSVRKSDYVRNSSDFTAKPFHHRDKTRLFLTKEKQNTVDLDHVIALKSPEGDRVRFVEYVQDGSYNYFRPLDAQQRTANGSVITSFTPRSDLVGRFTNAVSPEVGAALLASSVYLENGVPAPRSELYQPQPLKEFELSGALLDGRPISTGTRLNVLPPSSSLETIKVSNLVFVGDLEKSTFKIYEINPIQGSDNFAVRPLEYNFTDSKTLTVKPNAHFTEVSGSVSNGARVIKATGETSVWRGQPDRLGAARNAVDKNFLPNDDLVVMDMALLMNSEGKRMLSQKTVGNNAFAEALRIDEIRAEKGSFAKGTSYGLEYWDPKNELSSTGVLAQTGATPSASSVVAPSFSSQRLSGNVNTARQTVGSNNRVLPLVEQTTITSSANPAPTTALGQARTSQLAGSTTRVAVASPSSDINSSVHYSRRDGSVSISTQTDRGAPTSAVPSSVRRGSYVPYSDLAAPLRLPSNRAPHRLRGTDLPPGYILSDDIAETTRLASLYPPVPDSPTFHTYAELDNAYFALNDSGLRGYRQSYTRGALTENLVFSNKLELETIVEFIKNPDVLHANKRAEFAMYVYDNKDSLWNHKVNSNQYYENLNKIASAGRENYLHVGNKKGCVMLPTLSASAGGAMGLIATTINPCGSSASALTRTNSVSNTTGPATTASGVQPWSYNMNRESFLRGGTGSTYSNAVPADNIVSATSPRATTVAQSQRGSYTYGDRSMSTIWGGNARPSESVYQNPHGVPATSSAQKISSVDSASYYNASASSGRPSMASTQPLLQTTTASAPPVAPAPTVNATPQPQANSSASTTVLKGGDALPTIPKPKASRPKVIGAGLIATAVAGVITAALGLAIKNSTKKAIDGGGGGGGTPPPITDEELCEASGGIWDPINETCIITFGVAFASNTSISPSVASPAVATLIQAPLSSSSMQSRQTYNLAGHSVMSFQGGDVSYGVASLTSNHAAISHSSLFTFANGNAMRLQAGFSRGLNNSSSSSDDTYISLGYHHPFARAMGMIMTFEQYQTTDTLSLLLNGSMLQGQQSLHRSDVRSVLYGRVADFSFFAGGSMRSTSYDTLTQAAAFNLDASTFQETFAVVGFDYGLTFSASHQFTFSTEVSYALNGTYASRYGVAADGSVFMLANDQNPLNAQVSLDYRYQPSVRSSLSLSGAYGTDTGALFRLTGRYLF